MCKLQEGGRDGVSVDRLIKMLAESDLYTHLGACQALAKLKRRAAPAVPALRETLKAKDLWLRVKTPKLRSLKGK